MIILFLYVIRKIFYTILLLWGVNCITFVLFFCVNTPDTMARVHLGGKHVTTEMVDRWKHDQGYDQPLLKIFLTKSESLFRFDWGISGDGRHIADDMAERIGPSLAIAVPTLILGLCINLSIALCMTLFRGTWFDQLCSMMCVMIMSVSSLFYIIFGQFIFSKALRWAPLSGYHSGWSAIRYVWLPIMIGVISGIGVGVRWYRALFFEEMNKEYVRTAYAKGLSSLRILYVHVLKNALLPILTGVMNMLPTLFLGSLLFESFFGIPGLGSYTLDAIQAQDFDVVRVMVFLGTLLYVLCLIIADAVYVFVDPRVVLGVRKCS